VEGRDLAADPERCGRIVAADQLAAGGHQVIGVLAVRLLEQGDRPDRSSTACLFVAAAL